MTSGTALRVGTRGSTLARRQTEIVVSALRDARPTLSIEIIVVKTTGDRSRASLRRIGGQGAFTRELEVALLEGEIDVAVHSLKDLPSTLPEGLVLAAVPARGTPNDVLISRDDATLDELPAGVRVGTGSLRRQAQLLAVRPDLDVADIRGNVDTRLRKLHDGEYDAIVLAAAGLDRMGWHDRVTEVIPIDVMLPAPSQAALGLECRDDDDVTCHLVRSINDVATEAAVRAERAVLRRLGAGCRLPVGAYAQLQGESGLRLRARVVGFSGVPLLEETAIGPAEDAETLGYDAADSLIADGATSILG